MYAGYVWKTGIAPDENSGHYVPRTSSEPKGATMRRIVRATAGATAVAVFGGWLTALPASAGHVGCGQVIVVDTVLDTNIGPCATGISIGADDITLDLNGRTITGNPGSGDGPGIELDGRTGVTVTGGTVTQFDAGVAISGGSGNTVRKMRLINNAGALTADFGDGLAVLESTDNVIENNVIQGNGPFSGVSLIISDRNTLNRNVISGNNLSFQTSGVRIENAGPTASNANVITENTVRDNSLDGIQLFAGASDNVVQRNQSLRNGRDGITVFAGGSRNLIEANVVKANRGNGIFVRGAAGAFPAPMENRIQRNIASGNALFDLRDGTPDCGTNVWSRNRGATGTPPCVFGT